MKLHFDDEWLKQKIMDEPDDCEIGCGFEICDAPPEYFQFLIDVSNQRDNPSAPGGTGPTKGEDA